MATKLADAYVQIIPSAKGMKNSLTKLMSGEASSAGTSAGGLFTTAFVSGIGTIVSGVTKVTATAVAAASAGIAALTTSAVKSYAEYEQLVGGIDTLFTPTQSMNEFVSQLQEIGVSAKEASERYSEGADKVMENASNAWKTAGLSTNDYLETVTSFSASLIQSLGGDTVKAASYADMAITDMSDNANKMGTSIESIQNAYQGFAKQNYTMLDNLKLGYGGTKSEMERLVEDADALSESFSAQRDEAGNLVLTYADIVDAIHIVQDNMGISGTTAAEATTTIQGSLNQLKAAWSNMVTGLADENANLDELMQNVVDSLVGTTDEAGNKIEKGFLDNIIPRVETAMNGAGEMIEKVIPFIMNRIPSYIENVLPNLLKSGESIIKSIASGLKNNIKQIVSAAKQIIKSFGSTIKSVLPDLLEVGAAIVTTIGSTILDNLDEILAVGGDLLDSLSEGVSNNAGNLVDSALLIVEKLANFIGDNVDSIVNIATDLLLALASGIGNHLGELADAGLKIITKLAESIGENLVKISDEVPGIVDELVTGLTEEDQLDKVKDAFLELMDCFSEVVPEITGNILDELPKIVDTIYNYLSGEGYVETQAGATQMFEGILSALMSVHTQVSNQLGDMIVELAISLYNGQAKLWASAILMFEGILNALIEKATEITNKISSKIDEWSNKVKEKVTDFTGAGSALMDGLWSGFSARLTVLKSSFTGGLTSLVTAAKNALEINSPSKAFMRIGASMVEGLEVGWDKNIKSVQNDINKDMEFKGSINTEFTNNNAKTTSSSDNNGTRIVINETINLPSGDTKQVFYEYVVQTEGDKTRAVKISQGGY